MGSSVDTSFFSHFSRNPAPSTRKASVAGRFLSTQVILRELGVGLEVMA